MLPGIPEPDINLEIGSASHGQQTARMLAGIEEILLAEQPDWLLIYGDTNSTLAGALAAAKLHIPIAQVEAGLRSFNRRMPEEVNRILSDHISSLLLCPSEAAIQHLANEGISDGVHLVGDIMLDAHIHARQQARAQSVILDQLSLMNKAYVLVTLHRAENTDDLTRLAAILSALNSLDTTVVFPIHPRTRSALRHLSIEFSEHIRFVEPLGYLDMVMLEQHAHRIVTDSGGIQKEAYWSGIPCITLRNETEWVETVDSGWNTLVGADKEKIIRAARHFSPPDSHPPLYGDGGTANRCIELLETHQP